jgi:hypothetical protein
LRADRATSPYIREKFTRESSTARGAVREYFARFPKERYQTELEIWRYLPSQTIEFVMKRLREPIEDGGWSETCDSPQNEKADRELNRSRHYGVWRSKGPTLAEVGGMNWAYRFPAIVEAASVIRARSFLVMMCKPRRIF